MAGSTEGRVGQTDRFQAAVLLCQASHANPSHMGEGERAQVSQRLATACP
jgi:hypothetical protein